MNFVKHWLLRLLRIAEIRGYFLSLRWKSVEPCLRREVAKAMGRSFCAYPRFVALIDSIAYLDRNGIDGDIVICGVAQGGLAKIAEIVDISDRKIWLYDRYDGGSLAGENHGDLEKKDGYKFKRIMSGSEGSVRDYLLKPWNGMMSLSPFVFITGDILKTIPAQTPRRIALLYLDTDYYDTTRHEMIHLYPLVSTGGVVIQDDYGLCIGAKKAVDEVLMGSKMLVGLDESAVLWVK
jgi:O-methyltransferase